MLPQYESGFHYILAILFGKKWKKIPLNTSLNVLIHFLWRYYMENNDKIDETFKEVQQNEVELNNFWNKKLIALETKTVAVQNKLVADIKKQHLKKKLREKQVKLNELLEDNKKQIQQVSPIYLKKWTKAYA